MLPGAPSNETSVHAPVGAMQQKPVDVHGAERSSAKPQQVVDVPCAEMSGTDIKHPFAVTIVASVADVPGAPTNEPSVRVPVGARQQKPVHLLDAEMSETKQQQFVDDPP